MHSRPSSIARSLVVVGLCITTAACATLGGRWHVVKSSVVRHEPYYVGHALATPLRLSHLAVMNGGSFGFADPYGAAALTMDLARRMTAFLDTLNVGLQLSLPIAENDGPRVWLHCVDVYRYGMSQQRCDSTSTDLQLVLETPDARWRNVLSLAVDSAGADAVLALWLQFALLPARRNYTRNDSTLTDIAFLTSRTRLGVPDTPVAVLELAGALIDRGGEVQRYGAEVLYATQVPRLQEPTMGSHPRLPVYQRDMDRLLRLRLLGSLGWPLLWQAATRNLVARLLEQSSLAFTR